MTPTTMRNYVSVMLKSKNFRPDVNDVDDIVQNACLAALEKNVDLESKPFRGFLVITTLRYMQNTGKAKPKVSLHEARHKTYTEPTLERLITEEELEAVSLAIHSLPPYLKDTVRLMLTGMTSKEIASVLGVKRTTVSVNYSLIRQKIQFILHNL